MTIEEDTQTRLLEAAGHVFAEKGYKAATVREICQRAGARNVAAVNYYFRDKEQLYQKALQHAFRWRFEHIPSTWETAISAEQKLRLFIVSVLQHMLEIHSQPWQRQLLFRELTDPSAAGIELVRAFIRPLYEQLWLILRDLVPEISEVQLHLIGFSVIGQCFYHRVGRAVIGQVVGEAEAGSYTVENLAEHVTAFSLAGIAMHRSEMQAR